MYRVLMSKSEVHEAAVEVEAAGAGEATEIAKKRVESGMVALVLVHREVVAEVET